MLFTHQTSVTSYEIMIDIRDLKFKKNSTPIFLIVSLFTKSPGSTFSNINVTLLEMLCDNMINFYFKWHDYLADNSPALYENNWSAMKPNGFTIVRPGCMPALTASTCVGVNWIAFLRRKKQKYTEDSKLIFTSLYH